MQIPEAAGHRAKVRPCVNKRGIRLFRHVLDASANRVAGTQQLLRSEAFRWTSLFVLGEAYAIAKGRMAVFKLINVDR